MSHSEDPLAGTPYRMVAAIGQGGMGEVFEARHCALERPVVVKLIHGHLAAEPELVDRMRLEAQALAGLDHPHIVGVFDFGATAEGRPYLVMERLVGRTLREELRQRKTLPWREAIDFVSQALAGLQAVHEAGMVHRDIKLDNLFLCEGKQGRRVLKLLDFGIAKVVAPHHSGRAPLPLAIPTLQGTAVGSPLFFSPEQARAEPVDARADIYSMGIVLYMLLTGENPFPGARGFTGLAHAHVYEPPLPPRILAPARIAIELRAAILIALAKNPADRFASAAEFEMELLRIGALSAPMEWVETQPVDFRSATPRAVHPWDRGVIPGISPIFRALSSALATVRLAASGPAAPPFRPPMVTAPIARPPLPDGRGTNHRRAATSPHWAAAPPSSRSRGRLLPPGAKRWQIGLLIVFMLVTLAAVAAIVYGLRA